MATPTRKSIVWRRLNLLLCQVVDNYFVVADADRLATELDFQNLRYQTQLAPRAGYQSCSKPLAPR